jgi:hypothetical protein
VVWVLFIGSQWIVSDLGIHHQQSKQEDRLRLRFRKNRPSAKNTIVPVGYEMTHLVFELRQCNHVNSSVNVIIRL